MPAPLIAAAGSILGGMLGLGALRSVEKVRGANTNRGGRQFGKMPPVVSPGDPQPGAFRR